MTTATATEARIPDRRGSGREMIQHLLSERRDMLVLFCRVAGLDPFADRKAQADVLQAFCQILVDYMAAAHFSLYQRIVEGTERRRGVLALAGEIYGRIEACTQTAIWFNDKYDRLRDAAFEADLHADLSVLGEALATRIELEDRLIAALRGEGTRTVPTEGA